MHQLFQVMKSLQILNITKGGPCDRQDIRCDDILTHINQHSLAGQTLEGIQSLVLGREGSVAMLTLKRGGPLPLSTRTMPIHPHVKHPWRAS